MNRYPDRFMVLLIDFDNHPERLAEAKAEIPDHLAERVFVLGALTEPEGLKRAGLGSLEQIGLGLAKDCREGTDTLWQHPLLKHNDPELERMLQHIRPILFPSNLTAGCRRKSVILVMHLPGELLARVDCHGDEGLHGEDVAH